MPDLNPATPNPVAPAPSKGRTFFIRLGSTIGLWVLLTVGFTWKDVWPSVLMIALFGIGTSAEYFRLEKSDTKITPYRRMGFALSVAYWIVLGAMVLRNHAEPPWWLEMAALVAVVQCAFLVPLRQGLDGHATIERVYFTIFGVVYTAIMFGFLARILFLDGASSGRALLLMTIMVTKFSDMGAYAFGSWLGKHKMIPHISPAKTWEGLGGAFVGSFLGMICLMSAVPEKLVPLSWPTALILAPILCSLAVIGDLAESILKRCHQIKDSGQKLPGIGGMLDLTDSLLFTAPVCYFYLKVIA